MDTNGFNNKDFPFDPELFNSTKKTGTGRPEKKAGDTLNPKTLVDSTPGGTDRIPLNPRTAVDPTPRGPAKNPLKPGTLVDSTPGGPAKNPLKPGTLVDSTPGGPRAGSAPGSLESLAADMLDPENVMNRATANAFSSMEAFKSAVEKLPALEGVSKKKYPVKKTLSREGGESAVLLCSDPEGRDVVAKVYFEPVNGHGSSISARVRVLEYMATEDGKKYTLPVTDIGLVQLQGSRYYFEIFPFCKDGDLSHDKPFSFDEILTLTRYLNEALHSIHQSGIIHRDIKPANLYRLNGRIVIGDFGVARLDSSTATKVGVGTEGYRAPETLYSVSASNTTYIFTHKCDYYSLGITLGTLFEGRFVYENMSLDMITTAVHSGRVPLTRTDPKRTLLENLLSGLCCFDPKRRFGYEDVNRWLMDPNYSGGGATEEWPRPYRLGRVDCRDEQSLFEAITANPSSWNEGRDLLYRKYFEDFFKSFRPDLARAAQRAEETWRTTDRDKGLSLFLKDLFAPGPIVWKGYTFRSLQELAEKMVVTKTPAAYGEILQRKCVSHWLANTTGIPSDAATAQLVEDMERLAQKEPETACYWFGNSFSGRKSLRLGTQEITSLNQLYQELFRSPRDFYLSGYYDMLMNRSSGAALYGFLYSFGCQKIVDTHWAKLGNCDEYHKASILLAMLDSIAEKSRINPQPLRRFFLNYGPIGIATYTQKLLKQNGANVYEGLDGEGLRLLEQIASFSPAGKPGNADALFRAYWPLQELIQKLQSVLMDNPFCICTGVYEPKGVLCRNLSGSFAFRIFGVDAPLGFHAWIESAQGGGKR